MKIGITGNKGFVGRHLSNYLSIQKDIEVIPFENDYFDDIEKMQSFVSACDAIVHLAAVNRHEDAQYLYDKNIALADVLVDACIKAKASPHIIFSSSSQEALENLYGNAKKTARLKIENWAAEYHGKATGLIIPNVFGPFGKPNYNSVVATFCHKICRGETPQIIQDSQISLVYVNELIEDIYQEILNPRLGKVEIAARHHVKVSELLEKLKYFHATYLVGNEFPSLNITFDLALFNTFRCYVPHEHYPVKFKKNTDPRGTFIELARTNSSGQTSYSLTNPDYTRGNHFHTRKAERFAVIQGKALIQLRKIDSDEVISYELDGENPAFVDMPIWHTHNIKNIGEETLLTVFWINEPFDEKNPDTYFINV